MLRGNIPLGHGAEKEGQWKEGHCPFKEIRLVDEDKSIIFLIFFLKDDIGYFDVSVLAFHSLGLVSTNF